MYLCFRFIHKYILFKNVTLWPSYFPDMFWRKQCVRWWSSNRYVMKNGERNDQTIWQYSTKDVRRWGGILQLNIRACFQSMQVIRLQGIGKHHYILYILKLISKKKKKTWKHPASETSHAGDCFLRENSTISTITCISLCLFTWHVYYTRFCEFDVQ